MKNNKFLHIAAIILWTAQVFAEVAAGLIIWELDILPQQYGIPLVALLMLLALLTGMLILLGIRKSGKALPITAGCIALVLALLCGTIAFMGAQALDTLNTITAPTQVSAIYTVYVQKDNKATKLEDLSGCRLGILEGYDSENAAKALSQVESVLGQVNIVPCTVITEMINHLYNGELDAILLNDAYLGVLDSLEELPIYTDFAGWARSVHEITIVEETEPTEPSAEPTVESTEPSTEPEVIEEVEPFLIYLSGSDTRRETLAGFGRNDVNILAAVNPQTKQILLVNTPRDSRVEVPGKGGAVDKLTHCGMLGINSSILALESIYNVDIQYYAQINFTGFEKLINAIGGIEVYSDYEFWSLEGNCTIYKGLNQLNGRQALGFARHRKGLPGSDHTRGKHQMKVINAVVDKITTSTALITGYSEILESLEGMFVTTYPSENISNLVKMQLLDMSGWEIFNYAVPGGGGSEVTYFSPNKAMSMVYLYSSNVAHASRIMEALLSGMILTEKMVHP